MPACRCFYNHRSLCCLCHFILSVSLSFSLAFRGLTLSHFVRLSVRVPTNAFWIYVLARLTTFNNKEKSYAFPHVLGSRSFWFIHSFMDFHRSVGNLMFCLLISTDFVCFFCVCAFFIFGVFFEPVECVYWLAVKPFACNLRESKIFCSAVYFDIFIYLF